MRTRAITVPLLLAAIGVAGCGSSSNSAKTPATTATGGSGTSGGTVPSRAYTVKLAGSAEVPKGSPTGGGTATISIRGAKQQVCWNFHLNGILHPAAAHVHAGPAGTAGPISIPLGAAYTAVGCTQNVPKPELAKIVAAPKTYYVNVHNAKYPNGAVRAQL